MIKRAEQPGKPEPAGPGRGNTDRGQLSSVP